ncbi:MAG: cbb3-type cytochrome c oxidase subunit 3 [Planctomycetota bacterium]
MIKQAMSALGLEVFAVGGLLLFVAVFVGVCFWVTTRSRKEVDTWSSLPLADGTDPVEPRLPITTKDTPGPTNDASRHSGGGCGKCVDCSCAPKELVSVTTFTTSGV